MKATFGRTKWWWTMLATAGVLAIVFLAPPARATDKYWVGPNPDEFWSKSHNWSLTEGGDGGAGEPQASDIAFLIQSDGTDRTVLYDNTSNPLLECVWIDATGTGSITLQQNENPLSAAIEYIGYSGAGTFNQAGGSNTIDSGWLVLGYGTGATGNYTLSGTGELRAGVEMIGYGDNSTGTFNQDGGSNITTSHLIVNGDRGISGTYNLNAGVLEVGAQLRIGGTFIQAGGNSTVTRELYVEGDSGNYSLSGTGKLTAAQENILKGCTFNQTGGTNTVIENLDVGSSGGTGTYNMEGGSNTVKFLYLGHWEVGNGIYNLSGTGELSSSWVEYLGYKGNGTINQSGGKNTVGRTLFLGLDPGSSGSYDLSGGELSAPQEYVGRWGTGNFTQTGGSNTITTGLYVGSGAGSTGTYTLSGTGQLSAPLEVIGGTDTISDTYPQGVGTGTFNQIGGINTVTNSLILANDPGSSGTYNLEGGKLSAGTIQINPGGTFNISGMGEKLTTTVTGNVTNDGTIKTTNADVAWNGTFTNNGVYTSDPSDNHFNDLIIGPDGCLVAGEGDKFFIGNDFSNNSLRWEGWDTAKAQLIFTAELESDNQHNFTIAGIEVGEGRFAWGVLDITNQDLELLGSGTLFVGELLGLTFDGDLVTNLSSAANIFYDPTLDGNEYLDERNFEIPGGGRVAPTPVPASVLLLGSGLFGLGLLGWRRKRG